MWPRSSLSEGAGRASRLFMLPKAFLQPDQHTFPILFVYIPHTTFKWWFRWLNPIWLEGIDTVQLLLSVIIANVSQFHISPIRWKTIIYKRRSHSDLGWMLQSLKAVIGRDEKIELADLENNWVRPNAVWNCHIYLLRKLFQILTCSALPPHVWKISFDKFNVLILVSWFHTWKNSQFHSSTFLPILAIFNHFIF